MTYTSKNAEKALAEHGGGSTKGDTKTTTKTGNTKKGHYREVVKTKGSKGRTKDVKVTANRGSVGETIIKEKHKKNKKAVKSAVNNKYQKAIAEQWKKLNKQ